MVAADEFANPVLEAARSELARFGFRSLAAGERRSDWAAMWEILKRDFTSRRRPFVAGFDRLAPAEQEAAMRYMGIRLEADRLLDRCIEVHGELLAGGIDAAAVERYANVRESYENMIERFGDARQELDALLPASG